MSKKRVNWKHKASLIPSKVQIGPKVFFDVVWQKEIVDTKGNHLYGLTDLNNKIITIKMDMSPRLTIETYLHEVAHAVSDVYELGWTENQILGMEHAFAYILKDNNVFKKDE
jgi:hypothetical protein